MINYSIKKQAQSLVTSAPRLISLHHFITRSSHSVFRVQIFTFISAVLLWFDTKLSLVSPNIFTCDISRVTILVPARFSLFINHGAALTVNTDLFIFPKHFKMIQREITYLNNANQLKIIQKLFAVLEI